MNTADGDKGIDTDLPGAAPESRGFAQPSSRLSTRRSLLRAGLKSSPVILTLASRPVLAWHCKTPSAHASANLSNNAQQTWPDACTATSTAWLSKCNGATANDACGGTLSWPSGVTKITQYNSLMGSGSTSSIKTKLSSGSGFEKTLITAMLNVLTNRVPLSCLTVQDVKNMWFAGNSGVGYQPAAGISWTKQDMVNYLHNNWIATVSAFGGSPPSA